MPTLVREAERRFFPVAQRPDPGGAGFGGEPRPRLRVLVAEDDFAIRLMCRVNLALEGMEVVEATDGVEALELARANPPDVAVLDIAMPGLDGWQVADHLRALDIPVVFITANPSEQAERIATQLGALFVAKPFDPLLLADMVRAAAV